MELSLQLLTLDDYKYLSEMHIKLSTKEPAAALNGALRRLQLVRCELHLAFFSPAQLLIDLQEDEDKSLLSGTILLFNVIFS